MKKENKKVLVGMSGGVDSSVAALLLQKEGYEVEGIFIDFIGGEKSERDFQQAQKIAKKLDISIYKLDAQKIFKKKIIDKFVEDYENGITPNPCVFCNPEMKFKILIEEADKRGIEKVATGHYARLGREFPMTNNQFPNKSQIQNSKLETEESHRSSVIGHHFFVARDKDKDQSYFLYRLNQAQLGRIIFPLGEYLKSEVREIANKNGFNIKNEEESQDVCFIADNDFNKFIAKKIADKPGKIVNKSGEILGEHKGLHFYTIGQRKGINLGGDGPYFVIKKDGKKNQLIVSNNPEDLNCPDASFVVKKTNWILSDLKFPLEAKVKVRYRSLEEYAIITKKRRGIYAVKLKENQKAVTSGQSAVFYSAEGSVWGGGIII